MDYFYSIERELVLAANGGGGVFVVAYGPVIFGLVQWIRGANLEGTDKDFDEEDEPDGPIPQNGKCPSCNQSVSTTMSHCGTCGRDLAF